jgi:hypothetical protein
VQNRFRGHFALWSLEGEALDWPATNYVIVGQKARPGEGVRFSSTPPAECEAPLLSYLLRSHHRDVRTGAVRDLVRRPGTTVDVIPWFRRGQAIHVLCRRSYPRPILTSDPGGSPIDGSLPVGYISEPLNVQLTSEPLGKTVEDLLLSFPGVTEETILCFEEGSVYYPSPGGLQEQVRSVFVEIEPVNVRQALPGLSGLSTSGHLRAIEARQLLRAAQVGGLPEARLELNVYDLLLRKGLGTGPWIGETISLTEHESAPALTALEALLARPARRSFRRAAPEESSGFLELRSVCFTEHDATGAPLAERTLEVMAPGPLSTNTVSTCLLWRGPDGILLGVDDDDLPAAQAFNGRSDLLVTPAWRLPRDVCGMRAARAWIRARLLSDYGVETGRAFELGGRYTPSPGTTPEVVHPFAFDVTGVASNATGVSVEASFRLRWVPLADLVAGRRRLREGHLKIVALRAAHALGLLALVS